MTDAAGGAAPARRLDVDLLRVIGAVAVVCIHGTGASINTGADAPGLQYWLALAINAASRFAVPVFFAIAGWAQLSRRWADDEGLWLGRRLLRLVIPLTAWTVLYLILEVVLAQLAGGPPWAASGPRAWLSIKLELFAFGPGVKGQLWFLYFFIPMTIVIWLIQSVRRPIAGEGLGTAVDRRALLTTGLVALAFLGVLGAISVLKLPVTWTNFSWTLAYGVAGYAILSPAFPNAPRLGAVLFVTGTVLVFVLGRSLGYNSWPYFNQAFTVAIATIGILLMGRSARVPSRWAGTVTRLAGLTFGVYLAHFLVLDVVNRLVGGLNRVVDLPGPVNLFLVLIPSIVLSFALVAVWHRIPRLERILG